MTFGVLVLAVYLGYYVFVTYRVAGVAWIYLGVWWGEVALVMLITMYYGDSRTFHMHHYFLSSMVMICIGFQSI